MSDSVRPHRRQPTRLPCPWDSPGKNTGVGCHFLLQCMKVKSESEVAQSCPTLSDPMDCSLQGSSVHGILGKSTGVGCHRLLHKHVLGSKKKKSTFSYSSLLYFVILMSYFISSHSSFCCSLWLSSLLYTACQCRRHKRCGFDPGVGRSPGGEGMAAHFSILAWRIAWKEEPGGLQSTGCKRVMHY